MKTITKTYENGRLTKLHYQWNLKWPALMFIIGLAVGRFA